MSKLNKYSFGKCNSCKKEKALCNRRCLECNKKREPEIPDILKNIFKG